MTEQPRVAIATIMRPVGETGVQRHTATLAEGLRAEGVAVDVLDPFRAGVQWQAVFAVRRVFLRRARRSWSTRWYRHWHMVALERVLARTLPRRQPHALLAQDPLSAKAALRVRAKLDLSLRIVLVCHFNTSQADEFRAKGELSDEGTYERIRALEREVLEAVDCVVHVSEWSRAEVEGSRAIRPRESVVIRTGLDPDPWAPMCARAHVGLRDEDVVLVNVGTLEPRKNQVGLVRVFAEVARHHPAARLLLVGDGPARGAVERAIADAGVDGRVVLAGHRNDAPALLGLGDLYVHYARVENLPLTLIEAARAGLPVAAPLVGGIPELARPLDILPLPLDDAAAAAAGLRPLVVDAGARRARGERARAGFLRELTTPRMVRAYLDALAIR